MDIVDFPNYLIYDDGRVYSKKREIFLKTGKTTPGYLFYSLHKNGKRKMSPVHRLVAIHYIDNPNNYPLVDHIDINPLNNHVSNLRWCSPSQNNNNKLVQSNNKLGIKNIRKRYNGYEFRKKINDKSHSKWFKTLEEAIQYKDVFYSTLDDEFSRK